jgi:L-fuculose-phosphate aldolase
MSGCVAHGERDTVPRRLDESRIAVVHTHSAAACQFAALGEPLLPLDHAGSLFCYPSIPRFELTGGLIKTQELGQALAAALGEAIAILLPQHGIVTVGPDPTSTYSASPDPSVPGQKEP